MAPIFMVVGPPAVGKSTTSRALAARYPKSLHISVDDLRDMVISGRLLPAADWSDDLVQQITLARSSAIQMAMNYHAAGFTVVIDDFWDANHTRDYQILLDHPDAHKIILFPEQAQAHQRNFKRSGGSPARSYIDEGIQIVYDQLRGVLPQLLQQGWRVIDTSTIDIEETVTEIVQRTGTPA